MLVIEHENTMDWIDAGRLSDGRRLETELTRENHEMVKPYASRSPELLPGCDMIGVVGTRI
jgi:hypothetical protein